MVIAGKVLSMIVLGRVGHQLDKMIADTQAGFRPGRSTVDNIFIVRQIFERRHQYQQDTVAAFLDFSAAFDSLDRESMWLVLKRAGVPGHFIELIKTMYGQTTCKVRASGVVGSEFTVTTGVRQGDILSPLLFICAIDWIMSRAADPTDGVLVGEGVLVRNVEYADDVTLLNETVARLQAQIDRFHDCSKKLGLNLNVAKCKMLANTPDCGILKINDQPVEQVAKFNYLGSMVTPTGDGLVEVNARIGKAAAVHKSLGQKLWKQRDVPIGTKLRIFDAVVISVLSYGMESLPLNAESTRKIVAFEQRCLRGLLRIKWDDRITNEQVLQRCGRREGIESRLRGARMRYLGHIARAQQKLPGTCFFAQPVSHWKKRPGGQAMTWRNKVEADTKDIVNVQSRLLPRGTPRADYAWERVITTMAQDRPRWRELTKMSGMRTNMAGDARATGRR